MLDCFDDNVSYIHIVYEGTLDHLEIDEIFAYDVIDIAQFATNDTPSTNGVYAVERSVVGPIPLGTVEDYMKISANSYGDDKGYIWVDFDQVVTKSFFVLYSTHLGNEDFDIIAKTYEKPSLTAFECGAKTLQEDKAATEECKSEEPHSALNS